VEEKVGGNSYPDQQSSRPPADGYTPPFSFRWDALITQPLHPDYPFDLTQLTNCHVFRDRTADPGRKNSLASKTLAS
jgi:hypothetical protein